MELIVYSSNIHEKDSCKIFKMNCKVGVCKDIAESPDVSHKLLKGFLIGYFEITFLSYYWSAEELQRSSHLFGTLGSGLLTIHLHAHICEALPSPYWKC